MQRQNIYVRLRKFEKRKQIQMKKYILEGK